MATQKCPRCKSNRTRRGYRRTPFWSAMLFRYHLLCDNCNWEFTGFGIPFTVSSKPSKKRKKHDSDQHSSVENSIEGEPIAASDIENN
jgi:transcriptional regulator NrdR family protein